MLSAVVEKIGTYEGVLRNIIFEFFFEKSASQSNFEQKVQNFILQQGIPGRPVVVLLKLI